MNYRVERRKSPANFSFGAPSIFHRVASLLTPVHPHQTRDRDDKLYCVLWYQTREFDRGMLGPQSDSPISAVECLNTTAIRGLK